mmetsp:Transcript_20407/g.65163  ORF Transcript_20407/g.65163 Transcript_20407/m.65163 type:complete len:109 (-) Transcript_20407:130-456(-)
MTNAHAMRTSTPRTESPTPDHIYVHARKRDQQVKNRAISRQFIVDLLHSTGLVAMLSDEQEVAFVAQVSRLWAELVECAARRPLHPPERQKVFPGGRHLQSAPRHPLH